MDLQKYCEKRAMSGYGSALLYKEANEDLYHLVLPLETVPTVSGSVDTFDFDILTCPSKGQVEGKESLDQVDVDFMWHRDNVARLEDLQGRVLDFMTVYQDFTARTFTGTIKVRPQEAGADIMRGTFTITPMSATAKTILDARDLIMDTITFTQQIPSSLTIGAEGETIELKSDPYFSVTEDGAFDKALVVFEATSDNSNFVPTVTQVTGTTEALGAKVAIKKSETAVAGHQYGIVTITAYDAEYWDTSTHKPKSNGTKTLASWTTTIAVSY